MRQRPRPLIRPGRAPRIAPSLLLAMAAIGCSAEESSVLGAAGAPPSSLAGSGGTVPDAGQGGSPPDAGVGGTTPDAGQGGDEPDAGQGGADLDAGQGGADLDAGTGGNEADAGQGGDEADAGQGGAGLDAGTGGNEADAGQGGDEADAGQGGAELDAGTGGMGGEGGSDAGHDAGSPACGNGELEAGEQCDTAIVNGPGACPTLCDDGDGCTADSLVGSACDAHCEFVPAEPVTFDQGFELVATEWPIPDIAAWGSDFYWTKQESSSAYWWWTMADMNGDGRTDLVWPTDPDGYYDPWRDNGQPYWKVFLSTGTGFEPVATEWPIPDISAWGSDFYWTKQESSSAYWWWTMADMNGDGRSDLVWPLDPDGYYDPWRDNGQPYWKVFLNTGTGFEPVATEWAIPDISAWGSDFYWSKQESSSAYWWWTSMDIDGDGRPDLVWPTDPDGYYDPWRDNGEPFWKVFLNTGTGFELAATEWAIPDLGAWGGDFYWTKQESSSAYWWWTSMDIDGDGRPDLVWPTDPDGYYDPWSSNGQPYWKVFVNTGTGFELTATEWAIPDISAWGSDFYWSKQESSSAYWWWTSMDIDGDGRPDLVWPTDPDGYYDPWGADCVPYWKVFLNDGTGFVPAPMLWELPDIGAWGSDFYWTKQESSSAYWWWTSMDIDGDGRPDLVWPTDPDGYYDPWSNNGQPYWKVFAAR